MKERENYLMKPIPSIIYIIWIGLTFISSSYSIADNASSFFCKKIYSDSKSVDPTNPITDIERHGKGPVVLILSHFHWLPLAKDTKL